MAGVSVKMGVDVTQFRQGMQQAQQSAKTLNAQMKANEAQYKATGDREKYLSEQAKLLKQQLDAQKTAAANAEKALKAMRDNGVSETSAEYQKMTQAMANATAGMYDAQAAMNALTTSEEKAAAGAGSMSNALANMSRQISFDAINKGIDKITSGLSRAAQKAVELGTNLWDSILDTAAYADDIATLAAQLQLTTDEIQQMQYVANDFEASAQTIGKAWKKIRMDMSSGSEDVADAFAELGVATAEYADSKYGRIVTRMRDYKDVFWETGEAIMNMTDAAEQERYAQKLLGRSWDELIPLFTKGREAYEAAMKAAPVASEEAVNAAADLNARMEELERSWQTLKLEAIGQIAPELSKAATSVQGLLDSLTEYLKTDAGKQMMSNLSEAVGTLIDNLLNIDTDQLIATAASAVEDLTGALNWFSENSGTIIPVMEAIGVAFLAIKGASSALTLINALKGLGGSGLGGAGGTGGQQTVANETVTNQSVSNATFAGAVTFPNVSLENITTSNVTTMYVQTMIGGPGSTPTTTPGGGGNGGNPMYLPSGGGGNGLTGLNGYVPLLLPAAGGGGGISLNGASDVLNLASGEALRLGSGSVPALPGISTVSLPAGAQAALPAGGGETINLPDGAKLYLESGGSGTRIDIGSGTEIIVAGSGMEIGADAGRIDGMINAANGKVIADSAFQGLENDFAKSAAVANALTSPVGMAATGILFGIPMIGRAVERSRAMRAAEAKYAEKYTDLNGSAKGLAEIGVSPEVAETLFAAGEAETKKKMGALGFVMDAIDPLDSAANGTFKAVGDAAEAVKGFFGNVSGSVNTAFGVLGDLIFNPRENSQYKQFSDEAEAGSDVARIALRIIGRDFQNSVEEARGKARQFLDDTLGNFSDEVNETAERTIPFMNLALKEAEKEIEAFGEKLGGMPFFNFNMDKFAGGHGSSGGTQGTGGGGTPMYAYGMYETYIHSVGGIHANGLPEVPWDGYYAVLHKGERVVPAREVQSSRNYSSNLYVESMVMNNGQDAEALAAAMAAAQRRAMSGYGS